ncbi:M10 family metallopeptidase C-terminal domain-containing protein [Hasllibacter sp. MH4015]|uniref:M10 family metallopeptidase C-terminal domain-containing protein n=1 Tax=Hasllibacter sp. MH4015 TaxID=2854029 RepID=UPI001CD51E82|nr:M10 family metallopeptidase C-terminal domain-containing protein [Hasllibacter sp. MH4015]
MCQICFAFTPYLDACTYGGLSVTDPQGSAAPVDAVASMPVAEVAEAGDASANTSTQAALALGEVFLGTTQTPGDSDWIAVELVAGQTYTFAAAGVGALSDQNADPHLFLRDGAGAQLASDDAGGPGYNASITFTATTSGTYFLDVRAWGGSDSGTYGVTMAEGEMATYAPDMIAGNLIRDGLAWTSVPGTGATLTWAIRTTGENPGGGNPNGTDPVGGNPFIAPSPGQVAEITAAMAYLDGISNLTLNQVAPGATSDNATILFGAYSAFDGAGAYAYLPVPGGTGAANNAGDVWLNNTSVTTGAITFGSYAAFTILHEIGHAIGLAHPGDYNATLGVTFTYDNYAQFQQDSHQFTVMSYFNETHTGASGGLGFPDTFMLYDFLAIHQLYGADMSFHGGDTTYGFNATHGGTAYDFTANTNPFLTIFDGNGSDLIDLSGYDMAQSLSLVAGTFSDIGGYSGNLSIAYGALIERAIGGTGNDTIIGNGADNTLDGGRGLDEIHGGTGNDTIYGGSHNDILHGGAGGDAIAGELGNDTIYGGGDADRITGGNGNDLLDGGMGNDVLNGGRGDDLLLGGNRNDRLFGTFDDDTLMGGEGDDLLRGGTQNDHLDGGAGDDALFGGAGFDILIGGAGDDTLTGAFNADRFVFGDGHGSDVVEDFDALNKAEKLDFTGLSTLKTLADVLGTGSGTAAATQIGADVQIDTGSGLIVLKGVQYGDLDATDFLF